MNAMLFSRRETSMKRIIILLLVNAVMAVSVSQCATDSKKNFSGIWQGTLKVQSLELRIVFHLQTDSLGALKATMDSPDQGAKGIPVDKVIVRQDSISLAVAVAAGGYRGFIQPGDSIITGIWSQGGLSLPLDLHRILEVAQLRRPQEPKPPFPYEIEEVSYKNIDAGIVLAGTFTKPKSAGPFPALLLITGSGPQNRDEEILGHKPFFLLADYLTRRGIAVLRADDRGVGKSTGVFGKATSKDFAGDVRAGINYLKSRSDVIAKKIGLLGHSEGGLIAPMVADGSSDVAFVVLLAGPSLSGEEILYMQDSLILAAMGTPQNEIQKSLRINHSLYSLVKKEIDTTKLHQEIRSLLEQTMLADSTTGGKINESVVTATINQLISPWFRFFLTYDPVPPLKKLSCPVLALNGSKDLQVPAEKNLEGMREAFKASGNRNATAKLLPGLNHLFQKAETGAPLEYSKIEETMDPEALKVIGDWIADVTK